MGKQTSASDDDSREIPEDEFNEIGEPEPRPPLKKDEDDDHPAIEPERWRRGPSVSPDGADDEKTAD